jgi:IS1 family transposase
MCVFTATLHFFPLSSYRAPLEYTNDENSNSRTGDDAVSNPSFVHILPFFVAALLVGGCGYYCIMFLGILGFCGNRGHFWSRLLWVLIGALLWLSVCLIAHKAYEPSLDKIVPQKTIDKLYLLGYSIGSEGINMANNLNIDKQIAIIAALSEGSSIRSIERMTRVHRDTIMRLGVKVGQGCTALMDEKMRDLPCKRLEMDEIWGFIGKKEKHVKIEDPSELGSVWTFCAIDADTKLVPAFRVGDRDATTANAFLADVAGRMRNRVQISTDGLKAYEEAIERSFGGYADYGQIIKTYGHVEKSDHRRYSPPEFVSAEKKIISGRPNYDLISTSYIERLNATTRLHMRRLTRLTLAFSKKRENFVAAVGLHFAYYNFVKRHNTLRCTPAMAAGVTGTFWTVGDLVEATA